MENNNDTKPQFVSEYGVAKLSGMGIMGFIVGCFFLFYSDFRTFGKRDSIFHEIKYQPRTYFVPLIGKSIDSLNKEIEKTKADLNSYKNVKADDSIKRRAELIASEKRDSILVNHLSVYKQFFENVPDEDTLGFKELNNALHFQITPDSIKNWDSLFCIKRYDWESGVVNFYLKDRQIPFKLNGVAVFKAEKAKSDIRFITKYPSAGIWLLLVLIFCSFCFIAISTAINFKKKIADIFITKGISALSKNSYFWICFYVFLIIMLMVLLWSLSFYDEDIVKDLFFIKNLNVSMALVILLGTIAGSFCLAGFIYTASMLSYFAKPLIKIQKELKQQKLALEKAKMADLNLNIQDHISPAEQILLDSKVAEQDEQQTVFSKLTKIFQTYFLLAATILSLMVLCTGALYSTVNSLDFIKLLADDWGYSPARTDFIYLYGGLYSIVLLLVYIPAKMRFSEVDISDKPPVPAENAKWYDFLKDPFGALRGTLVATSPLLVSLIQSLLDVLFR